MDWEGLLEMASGTIADWGVKIVSVIVALFVAWLVAGWVQRTVKKRLAKRLDVMLVKFLANFSRYLIIIGAVLGCLGVFGIETTSFAAVIGAAGLAIGLAFQGTLSNFSAGVMLMIFRPFTVGNMINVGGTIGVVEELDLFSTELKTPDNRRIIVPNGSIFGSTIENITHHPTRRIDIPVGVDYTADIDKVREVLEKAAPKIKDVLKDPEPMIFLESLGDSAVNWQVRVWCKTEDYWNVYQATVRGAKMALDEAGISIPFPQQDVHLDPDVVGALAKK